MTSNSPLDLGTRPSWVFLDFGVAFVPCVERDLDLVVALSSGVAEVAFFDLDAAFADSFRVFEPSLVEASISTTIEECTESDEDDTSGRFAPLPPSITDSSSWSEGYWESGGEGGGDE